MLLIALYNIILQWLIKFRYIKHEFVIKYKLEAFLSQIFSAIKYKNKAIYYIHFS